MSKNIVDEMTTKEKQTQKVNYYFLCACGCGQMSEKLGKGYIRLRKSQKWYHRGCVEGKEIVQEFKGGYVINEPDF